MANRQTLSPWQGMACATLLMLSLPGAAYALPDYELLDDLLLTHVRDGFVDYDGLALDPRLDDFVTQLGATSPAELISPEALKAFYINAYNAIVLQGILAGQSPAGRFGRWRFFKRMRVQVLGEAMSLEDIEHGRLRPMGDARIHFALVCASLSCPRLANRAFRPGLLDGQLNGAAERFLNDPTRNRFDPDQKIAFVSRIFDWFDEDFTAVAGSLQPYMARFVTDQSSARILRSEGFELRFDDYDWSLNGSFSR
ncbi:MAG: DUF547 domain-containing protein [Gammaproteobacteria bacterium]